MAPDQTKATLDVPEQLTSHRINGVVDLPRPTRVAGWAIDRADPDAAVRVEILRDGHVIAQTIANTFRADLQRSGLGTGKYGFAVDLDAPMPSGMAFTISARAKTSDGLEDDLRQIGQTALSDAPEERLLQEIISRLNVLAVGGGGPRDTAEQQTAAATLLERALLACDRVETVQARLETMEIDRAGPADHSVPRWLTLLVALSLVMGAGALAIGIASLLPV